jgi:hypothetical protein
VDEVDVIDDAVLMNIRLCDHRVDLLLRTSILRRSDAVSGSFILFREYPRFGKIDLVGQNFLILSCVLLELYFSKFMVIVSLTSSSITARQT